MQRGNLGGRRDNQTCSVGFKNAEYWFESRIFIDIG